MGATLGATLVLQTNNFHLNKYVIERVCMTPSPCNNRIYKKNKRLYFRLLHKHATHRRYERFVIQDTHSFPAGTHLLLPAACPARPPACLRPQERADLLPQDTGLPSGFGERPPACHPARPRVPRASPPALPSSRSRPLPRLRPSPLLPRPLPPPRRCVLLPRWTNRSRNACWPSILTNPSRPLWRP